MMRKSLYAVTLSWLLTAGALAEDITVSAAASLTNAFNDIAKIYEAAHPEDKVLLNFGASGTLLQQIAKGAPVDVFASADQATMDKAQTQGLIDPLSRKDFVQNSLVLIVPSTSSLTLETLMDLTKDSITRIAVGNPDSVPVGNYTKNVLEKENLWAPLGAKVIGTQNVRQSLDYVARGEVDVGFVYGTDAAILKDKVRILLTVPVDQPINYPIAKTLAGKKASAQFINFIFSDAAQAILTSYGFAKP